MSANTDMTRYYVGDTSELEGMSYAEVEEVTHTFRDEAEDDVADLIDEIYGNVSIAGLEYAASYALRSVDPTAWRVLLADYIAEVDMSDYPDEEPDEEDECTGECITRPHLWSASGARCTRTGCSVVGTGDMCGDGDCEGDED